MQRTILAMILFLAAATAAASEEPSPRRGGYILLGADLQGTYLHVTEDGQPDRSPAGWAGGGQVGFGLHVAPRVDVYFLLESLGSDPRFNVMGLGATWYPRGWRFAAGDLFLEGRWSHPSVVGKFLRTGCPEWEESYGSVLAVGAGWNRVLSRNQSGAATVTLRLGASIHGIAADLRNVGDGAVHGRLNGLAGKVSAALLLSQLKGDRGPWDEEPSDFAGVPFIGVGTGWGRHTATVNGFEDAVTEVDGDAVGGSIRGGYRRATWFVAVERSGWNQGRGWTDPELALWRFTGGWRVFRLPVELLGGYGTMDERVAVDMGDCEPTRRVMQHAWSAGVGIRLLARPRWSLGVRAEFSRDESSYEIEDSDFDHEHPGEGSVLRSSRSDLVSVGVTLDWNLLPLRRD